jgi:hypothetical protein
MVAGMAADRRVNPFTFEIDQAWANAEAALDGIYVVCSNAWTGCAPSTPIRR